MPAMTARRGVWLTELALLLAVLTVAMVGTLGYAKALLRGKRKADMDTVGRQFSVQWSNLTTTTTSHSLVKEQLDPDGTFTSTFLDPAYAREESQDDFSGKRLDEMGTLQ